MLYSKRLLFDNVTAEALAVPAQVFDLPGGNRVFDGLKLVADRNVVIRDRKSHLRYPDLPSTKRATTGGCPYRGVVGDLVHQFKSLTINQCFDGVKANKRFFLGYRFGQTHHMDR